MRRRARHSVNSTQFYKIATELDNWRQMRLSCSALKQLHFRARKSFNKPDVVNVPIT